MGAFSSPSWAQPDPEPEPEPDPMPVRMDAEAATMQQDVADQVNRVQDFEKVEVQNVQIEKTQELQQVEGQFNQAVAIDRAALKMEGCKVQKISLNAKDEVVVGAKCSAEGAQDFDRVLFDKSKDGVVDAYDDGLGIVAFSSIDSGKEPQESAVSVQYDSAMKVVGQAIQGMSVAHRYRRFGIKENCNQFVTEQGIKYEFFARVGLSDKNQPIILGYKIIRIETDPDAVNKDAVTIDISMGSASSGAFAGILPVIHAGGCPVSEWIEFPQVKSVPIESAPY